MLLMLELLLLLLLLWRGRLWVMLLLGIVWVPWDVPFVVGVVRSSHTVEHGMTAEILGSKLDHCRHLGESATNRQLGSEICVC